MSGRSKISGKPPSRAKSNRHSPRKDDMGYIDPDHIDQDVFEEPDNIPPVATAAAATAVERPGDAVSVARDLQFGYEIEHDDEGIGEDEYVLEKNVDEYNKIGIVKSNIYYDEDSDFADEEQAVDMSYFRSNNGRRGRSLTMGVWKGQISPG